MIALRDFTGIVGGKEKTWREGDKIDVADAKSLGLESKPGLAKKAAPSPKGKTE